MIDASARWARHWRLRVSPAAWSALLLERTTLADEPYVKQWAELGWPMICTRVPPDTPRTMVSAGLSLPPSAVRRRFSLLLPADAIERAEPPLKLLAAAPSAPAAWARCIEALIDAAPDVAVFGSLALQQETGLAYLRRDSDLDVLLAHHGREHSERLLRHVAEIAASAPMRLDGELIRADGTAAQWRELHGGAAEVLVKKPAGVALMRREDFLA